MITDAMRAWLDQHGTHERQCVERTAAMVRAFPELTRVRGHYICPLTERTYTHWWCVTAAGEILDPTVEQFPSCGLGAYIPHEGPEPTGKCPNCGGYCYTGGVVCSDACGRAYEAYVRGG